MRIEYVDSKRATTGMISRYVPVYLDASRTLW